MAGGKHSNIWTGYDRYEAHRGTLVGSTTDTVTFNEAVASLVVQHKGNVANSMYVTIDTVTHDATEPTDDGTGDDDNEMIEVTEGAEVSLDVFAKSVQIRSAGAVRFQVIGLRV